MSEHVSQWLEAYYDGELTERRARQVEAHLETCTACQAELESLGSLSDLLRQAPEPTNLTPPEVFASQVGLRLPRKPEHSPWQKALHTGWQWLPFGLLGAWSFVQAALLISGLVSWFLQLVPQGASLAAWLPQGADGPSIFEAANLSGAGFSEIGRFGLDILRDGGPLGWGITLNLVLSALVGVLFLSWLAGWWVQKSTENQQ